MSLLGPQDFLGLLARHAARSMRGAATRPNRLAVIDPAYSAASFPGTLPKVTFEGEGTLSAKGYNVAGGYSPQPSHRVLLVPVGNTYVIVGKLAS